MLAIPTAAVILGMLASAALAQGPAPQGAEPSEGQLLYNNHCRMCHTTREGDNRLGPNLHKIIGRKAGSIPNYNFSSAMSRGDLTWDKDNLERFIANPDAVVPGHNMRPYGGVASADERAKIVAFLAQAGGQ